MKCWGRNSNGQLGYGDSTERPQLEKGYVDVGAGRTVKQVFVGVYHTCALLDNNTVKCWGSNSHGQLGYGDTASRNKPGTSPIDLGQGRTAKQLALGYYFTCALLDNNSVKCWGHNGFGQLGYGDKQVRRMPAPTPIDLGQGRTAKQVSAGSTHTCVVLDNDTVKCWGYNAQGQLGYGNNVTLLKPSASAVDVGTGRTVKQVSVGATHTCAVLDNDTVKCWGDGTYGQLGTGSSATLKKPPVSPVDVGTGRTVKQVALMYHSTCALLDNNTVKCWGGNQTGQLGYGFYGRILAPSAAPVDVGLNRTVEHLTVGYSHVCVLLDNNTVKCWGDNSFGHLGYGDKRGRLQPEGTVPLGTGWLVQQIAAGFQHVCAVMDDRSLKCWGSNDYGQLGYGNTTPRLRPQANPVNLGSGRTAKMLDAGQAATCALLDNNTVKCWGNNSYGGLGYNDTQGRNKPSNSPIDLGSGRTAKQVSLYSFSTCAILDNNSLKCWGKNDKGQLGYSDTTQREKPDINSIDLGTGRTARIIEASNFFSCAILNDGSVKCWGGNNLGQLGYGDQTDRTKPDANPIDLGTGRTAKQLALGHISTCALLDNGTVKCWGNSGSYGRLGYGTTGTSTRPPANPINFGSGRTALSIAFGTDHGCAILDNGTLKCWGRNHVGQLGYGDTTTRLAPDTNPVNLGAGRTAKQVTIGDTYFTCALLDNNTVKCWGGNGSGQLGYGDKVRREKPDINPVTF